MKNKFLVMLWLIKDTARSFFSQTDATYLLNYHLLYIDYLFDLRRRKKDSLRDTRFKRASKKAIQIEARFE